MITLVFKEHKLCRLYSLYIITYISLVYSMQLCIHMYIEVGIHSKLLPNNTVQNNENITRTNNILTHKNVGAE